MQDKISSKNEIMTSSEAKIFPCLKWGIIPQDSATVRTKCSLGFIKRVVNSWNNCFNYNYFFKQWLYNWGKRFTSQFWSEGDKTDLRIRKMTDTYIMRNVCIPFLRENNIFDVENLNYGTNILCLFQKLETEKMHYISITKSFLYCNLTRANFT